MNNMLVEHGYFAGVSKSKYREALRANSNLTAVADIYDRVTGAQSVFYDILDGTNDHSAGLMDTTATTITVPTIAGETVLDPHVASTTGFVLGQEITIQDDVHKEYTTVTRAETVATPTVYDRSTPTTVVASAYTTSASARPQVLSNGWVVSASINGTIGVNFQVSKDNGVTFNQLCTGNSGVAMSGLSLCSYGTKVYCLATSNSTPYTWFQKFDANTIANVDINFQAVPDTSQTTFGGCSLAIDSTGTYLHASWSSKNTTYPNSFNIRYCKGTIAGDGSVSWGGVLQVTTLNGAGFDITYPCITLNNLGNPFIAHIKAYSSGAIGVMGQLYNGSTWSEKGIFFDGGTYTQSSPDSITDKNGVLWCAWFGYNSTYTARNQIFYSKSTDSGATWITAVNLTLDATNQSSYPSITSDKNANIYIMYIRDTANNTPVNLWKFKYDGSSWVNTQITNYSAGSNRANAPSTCSNTTDFTDPITIFTDTVASLVKFRGIFTITTQVPHLEVTALTNAYKINARVYRSLGYVDTVNKRLKFSSGFFSSATYDRSTPTTVVASAYVTSGNSGRKLVRLSNGWLVSLLKVDADNSKFYVSTNNGISYSLLTSMTAASHQYSAMCSIGTNIYALFVSNSNQVYLGKFDATTVGSTVASGAISVDTNQSTFSSGCSIEADSLGYLHATWCSKNATYPSSFNIRYSKSIDGGVTWATPTQVTQYNSGYHYTNPCIIIKDNNPYIIAQWSFTGYEKDINIFSPVLSGYNRVTSSYCSWPNTNIYTSSYAQSNPSAVVDSAGAIHCVWQGTDAASAYDNLRYSKSTDGGNTWSAMFKLTTATTENMRYASIAVNNANNIFILHQTETNNNSMYLQQNNGTSWITPVLIDTATGVNSSPSLCGNYTNFTSPLMIYCKPSAVMFRGVWTETSYTPFLSEDLRYAITPATGTTPEIDSWIQYEQDAGFSVDSKISIVATGATEVYGNPAKTTYVAGEDQYIYYASARGARATERITITRTVNTLDKAVTRVLGAVIA